ALKPLKDIYGMTIAAELGPLKLEAVREKMISDGLSRTTVNQRIWRIKKMYRWAVKKGVVPVEAWQRLLTVEGRAMGRTGARETDPVTPVPEAHADAVLKFLPPPVKAMVQLQRLAGMRPGEVCRMRAADIDMTEDIWLFRPRRHKNSWRGQSRVIALSPKAK